MNAFWLLCVTLSLAVLFLGSALGALLANLAAWLMWRFGRAQLLRSAQLLFSIRLFPSAFGAILTAGFALPSFLLLEPTRSVEAPEPYLLALASLAVMAIVAFAVRCTRLVSRSQKTLESWLKGARLLPLSLTIPVYEIERPESLIAVIGIFRPKVFVGSAALASLGREEFEAAVAHELAHVRSQDNLKQLALKITRLPLAFASLAKMDVAWSAAAELSADKNALKQGTSALALCSAIVKIGRLKTFPSESLAVAACHLIPPDGSSSALALRIEHLQNALEAKAGPRALNPHCGWPLTLLSGAILYLLVLPAALPVVHRWTEWLVK